MSSQSHSNLRFIYHGVAALLSIALHVGIMRIRIPTPPTVTPQGKTPPLVIPQQAVQVRPRPPKPSRDVAPPPPPTQPPASTETATPLPTPIASEPAIEPPVTVEPEVRSQEQETPPNPSATMSKLLEEKPPRGDQPDIEPKSSPRPDPSPSPSPEQSLALQWDGLVSNIQAKESEFGQAQSLQDIFILYGQDQQFDLFFDQADQPTVQNSQLSTVYGSHTRASLGRKNPAGTQETRFNRNHRRSNVCSGQGL